MWKRKSKQQATPTGRVAIGYCRCSTEEQSRSSDYNTLQAQEQLIREYCAREHPDWTLEIVHEVRSAKDTNRPQLQQILRRVQAGEVCAVIVYRLDRFARSVKDLLVMSGLFEQHGTELISLKEQLDTTTALGRMYRTLMALIAEFEREVIAERIRDKMHTMAAQGLWIRGRAPFGYRLNREAKKLEVDAEAAEWIRFIFQRFRETGCAGRVAKELQENPDFQQVRRARGYRPWFRSDELVDTILSNAIYVGDMVYGGRIAATGAHEPIIDRELFELVQGLLPNNRMYRPRYSPATEEDPYLLRGSIFCSECGVALTPRWVQGNRLVHYYDHPRKSFCSFQRVNAERVHQAVWRVMGAVAQMDALAETALLETETAEAERSRREIERIGQEIERLLLMAREGLGDLPELSRQIGLLQARRAELAREVRVVDVDACRAVLAAFRRFAAQWDASYHDLTLQERREAFALVVSRVEVGKTFARVWVPVSGKVRNSCGSGGADGTPVEPSPHSIPSITIFAISPLDLQGEVLLQLK